MLPIQGLPDVLTSCASSLIKLACSPSRWAGGIRYKVDSVPHQVQRYVSSCLSQTRTKISSAFCSRICLLSEGRHCIFCNRINHFVRLSECRMKILPQNLFSFWSILYFLWILLPFKKKGKKKPIPTFLVSMAQCFRTPFQQNAQHWRDYSALPHISSTCPYL